ncbi:MAG: dephospho-CoA kinase [Chloroflexi bacterium]|nr:dephospho-CoA kinase [Chloroflexota bacterium]MQC47520.1 dephospho-CoA kinase [Chloroflexota bacterium]
MTIIGLTGGIASGKSTAAEILRELGASIIDGDRLGHRSYEPGTPGFQKVVNAFGHDIVAKDGTIDRRILGGKVFGAPGELDRLNGIVWPEIRTLIQEEIKQIRAQEKDPIIVIEAAVLLEAKWQDLCDEVWVVTTPVETAVERMKARNGLTVEAAMARINSQMSNKERTEAADVKIENSSTEEELNARVERAWRSLQTRIGRKAPPRRSSASQSTATKTGTVKRTAAKSSSPSSATGKKGAAPKASAASAGSTRTTAAGKSASTKAASGKSAGSGSATKKAASAAKPSTGRTTTAKGTSANASGKKPATTRSASASAKAPQKPAARSGGRAK